MNFEVFTFWPEEAAQDHKENVLQGGEFVPEKTTAPLPLISRESPCPVVPHQGESNPEETEPSGTEQQGCARVKDPSTWKRSPRPPLSLLQGLGTWVVLLSSSEWESLELTGFH